MNSTIVLAVMIGMAPPETPQQLADLHGAATARWVTIDAVFEVVSTIQGRDAEKRTVQFQQSGDRNRFEDKSLTSDVVVIVVGSGGKTTTFHPTGGPKGEPFVSISAGRMAPLNCNPPGQLLFLYNRSLQFGYSLSEFLTQPMKSASVSRVRESGRDLVLLQAPLINPIDPKRTYDYSMYFDPAVNYLQRKQVFVSNGVENRSEAEVVEFKEIKPGIYFPVEGTATHYSKNKVVQRVTIKAVKLQINEPIDNSRFELAIPPKSKVYDQVNGESYDVDESGRKTGTPKKLESANPISIGRVSYPGDEEPTPYQQRVAAAQSSSLFVYLAIGALTCCLAAYFISRRTKRIGRQAVP